MLLVLEIIYMIDKYRRFYSSRNNDMLYILKLIIMWYNFYIVLYFLIFLHLHIGSGVMQTLKKIIKLSSKFQLTLPNDIRNALDIKPNEILTIEINSERSMQISKNDFDQKLLQNHDSAKNIPNKNQESKIIFTLDKTFGILRNRKSN